MKKQKFIQFGIEETLRNLAIDMLMLLIPIIGLKTLDLNNSSIGAAVALSSMGYLFFGYVAGIIADKWGKKKVLISSLFLKSITFGYFSYLVLTANLTPVIFFVLITFLSLVLVIIETTMTSWMPEICETDELPSINGVIQFSRSSANLIGPALGGLIIGFFGESSTLFIISLMIIISAIIIFTIRQLETSKPRYNNVLTRSNKFKLDNFIIVIKNPVLRSIVLTTATINFSFAIFTAMSIIFLIEELTISTALTGILISLGGIGAIIGSLIAPRLIKKYGVLNVMVYGPIIPNVGLLITSFAYGKYDIFIFSIGIIAFFAARSIGSVARVTAQQLIIPEHIRGKVSGTIMMLTWGAIPVGALSSGILSEIIGLRGVMIFSGILLLLSNAWMFNKELMKYKNKELKSA
jgi:MFS family permease